MLFGQIVIGSPGSGKSTYCAAIAAVLEKLGRKPICVNLDFANDKPPYEASIDVGHLITVQDVMEHCNLGPNGGLIYCAEFLDTNFEWLESSIKNIQSTLPNQTAAYYLFDLPGQVELFTHNESVRNVVGKLMKAFDFRLVCLNLIDSHYCSDAGKFISACLTCLSAMLRIELPHLNVMSKMDLIDQFGQPDISLNYYLDTLDMNYILEHLQLSTDSAAGISKYKLDKYKRMNESICGLIEDYSLVTFQPFSISDQSLMMKLVKACDKANGYIYYEPKTHSTNRDHHSNRTSTSSSGEISSDITNDSSLINTVGGVAQKPPGSMDDETAAVLKMFNCAMGAGSLADEASFNHSGPGLEEMYLHRKPPLSTVAVSQALDEQDIRIIEHT